MGLPDALDRRHGSVAGFGSALDALRCVGELTEEEQKDWNIGCWLRWVSRHRSLHRPVCRDLSSSAIPRTWSAERQPKRSARHSSDRSRGPKPSSISTAASLASLLPTSTTPLSTFVGGWLQNPTSTPSSHSKSPRWPVTPKEPKTGRCSRNEDGFCLPSSNVGLDLIRLLEGLRLLEVHRATRTKVGLSQAPRTAAAQREAGSLLRKC